MRMNNFLPRCCQLALACGLLTAFASGADVLAAPADGRPAPGAERAASSQGPSTPPTGQAVKKPAPQEQQAAKIVKYVVYTDASGNVIHVWIFDNGDIAVVVNNAPAVFGVEAWNVLAAGGISLTVSPGGEIVSHHLAGDAGVLQPARDLTPAEAADAGKRLKMSESQSSSAQEQVGAGSRGGRTAMPANIAPGSQSSGQVGNAVEADVNAVVGGNTLYDNNVNGNPVSR